ncbi:MAG: sugar phosphate isomerase/epimerase family protein [Candidatus Bathyarchaeia archaeon]
MVKAFGIDTWIYSILPPSEAIKRIKSQGLDVVEYCYDHFRNLENESMDITETCRQVVEVANSYDVKAIQVHGPFGRFDVELASSDHSVRKKALDRAKMWMELTSLLGADVLVLHTAIVEEDILEGNNAMFEKARKSNLEAFRDLDKLAREEGVKVAIENRLEKIFAWRPVDLVEFINALNSDYMGICLDVGHANVNGIKAAEMVEIMRDLIIATHLHDNDGFSDQHLPPLMGCIDWEALVKALGRYPYPLILEIRDAKDIKIDENNLTLSKVAMDHLFSKAG